MHHQNSLQKVIKNSVISNNVNPGNYYKKIIENKPTHGINASSISDISNIPRATVIRKLKWLIKNELVKKK